MGFRNGLNVRSVGGFLSLLSLLLAAPALAADPITCTPRDDVSWSGGEAASRPFDPKYQLISTHHMDLDTGAYFDIDRDGEVENTETWSVLDWGSLKDPVHFIAVDLTEGNYIRIDIRDQAMPFMLVDLGGGIRVGTCVRGDKR